MVIKKHDFSIHKTRTLELLQTIKQENPDVQSGIIVLFAAFETNKVAFRQESSFYYFTGVREPGVVWVMDLEGHCTLYIPNCAQERCKWTAAAIELHQENAHLLHVDRVEDLGEPCGGYQLYPYFGSSAYANVLKRLETVIANKGTVFTLAPTNEREYPEQRFILGRVESFLPGLAAQVKDISSLVAHQRRSKDMHEIELLYKAVEITALAHEAAAQVIAPEMNECEVQASLEYMFTGSQARAAFPTIVGSGKNSTILHYTENHQVMKKGDLVVVDIGAEYNYYCADLTRTYPVSGKFTKRQQEIYELVLETQTYIAQLAKPGYWLSNGQYPDKSLNHLAKNYLQEKGYGEYFPHGLGHFLGIDVHDVGDYSKPLQVGDVITIEPGIYLPEESLGVRIEDDYWIVAEGVICLSEQLPKSVEDIEALMKERSL